ncbi:hypothetical protein LMIY3S_04375 [Labrys miyagiensis]
MLSYADAGVIEYMSHPIQGVTLRIGSAAIG